LGALERLAALRDRPFHPTARAKYGWNVEEYSRYGAEFGHPLAVDWLAVRRDYLRTGAGATGEGIAPFVLSQEECGLLDEAMRNAALTSEQYLPLPVHPWQMQHVLPTLFEREWQEGICVPLHRNLGSFVATSSVRTLMPVAGCAGHLKLALGIHALGALRTLPARYMENGQKAQTLLQAVIERDSLLRERLLFCQEDAWWAFFDPEGDPFDGRYGQLACLLRRYPGELFAADTLPIPMSALTVTEPYILFARLLRERGADPADAAQALVLLREICDLFILVSLTCACYGLLPEMHGQNVLLLARQGRITQLVLRDHDTVRIHLPWLHEAELPDPEYTVKPNTRNTLILHTPEALLSYFQTLGMQVNLYALVRTLEVAYGVDELHGWRVIEDSLRQTLADISCPTAKKGLFTRTLLDAATWPTKCLVRPLLQRATVGDEGMPSSTGVTVNPFHKAGALRRDFSWENL
jgi:siderophore synthetase component